MRTGIPRKCSIFIDMSNMFSSLGKTMATTGMGLDRGCIPRRLRLHFGNLLRLAAGKHEIVTMFCVTSTEDEVDMVRYVPKLRELGVEVKILERGGSSGTEQGVDQTLQVQMLRTAIDSMDDPGIVVLLTGDGAGAEKGEGFLADLQRIVRCGSKVRVLAWRCSCATRLRAWAREHGEFVELDNYYSRITFVEGGRKVTPLPDSLCY